MDIISDFLDTTSPRISTPSQEHEWKKWIKWRQLHSLGFNLVPAISRTKKPKMEFLELMERRQTNEEVEALRRKHFFACDMLILTGDTPDMKVVVLDPDDEAAEALFKRRCPESPMKTGTRRGFHRFYKHPGSGIYVPQQINHIIDGTTYKIDRKADRNYVVAPGSIHESGYQYDWVDPWSPDMVADLPVYDPDWLPHKPVVQVGGFKDFEDFEDFDHEEACEDCSVPIEDRTEQARRYLAKGCPGTTEGEGTASNACLRVAGKVAIGFLLPFEEAVDVLMDEWADKHDQSTPWTEKQIRHKVRAVIKTPWKYPGHPGDKIRQDVDDTEDRIEAVFAESRQDSYTARGDVPEVKADRREYDPRDYAPRGVYEAGDDPVKTVKTTRKRRGYRPSDIRDFEDPKWLVQDHIVENTLCGIFGAPASFKSFYALDLAFSIATGTPFLGRYPVVQGLVLYVYAEGRGGMRRRLLAWETARGITLPEDKVCIIPYQFSFSAENGEAEVEELLRIAQEILGTMPTIIFIDTLSRNFGGGDENATKDMNAFVGLLDRIKDGTNGSVVPIHHTGKDATRKERGSNVLRASADTLIEVERKSETDPTATIKCAKQKDADPFVPYQVMAEKVMVPGGDSLVLTHKPIEPDSTEPTTSLSKQAITDRKLLIIFHKDVGSAKNVSQSAMAWNVTTENARKRLRDLHAREYLERVDGSGPLGHSYYLSTRGGFLLDAE